MQCIGSHRCESALIVKTWLSGNAVLSVKVVPVLTVETWFPWTTVFDRYPGLRIGFVLDDGHVPVRGDIVGVCGGLKDEYAYWIDDTVDQYAPTRPKIRGQMEV